MGEAGSPGDGASPGDERSPTHAESLLDRIVAWAKAEPNVRALVLVGSRAGDEPPDGLADIDLRVYAKTTEPYTGDDEWLSELAPVWLCVRDEYRHADLVVPTRLVLFEGGIKVDFALYPAAALADHEDGGEPASRVLVDKDRVAPDVRRRPVDPAAPSEEEFARVVGEFWFEAYHVAKYLARGELWLAKARDWETKRFLLKMIEWHARAGRGWNLDTRHGGARMRSWAGGEVWADLHGAFSRFDAEDGWRGLSATTELFRRLARETAAILDVAYPEDVDRNISRFIEELERGAGHDR